jgi:asparagine N-glycosylation enzyme membrane subunit Stt3
MNEPAYPRSAHDNASDSEELERLETAMDAVPSGALVVSGVAVGLLMLCWLAIYIFVFLPRGTVG